MLLPAPSWSPSTPEDYFRFGLFRFRSPLLTESISLSFPPLTEMFHFSGSRVHNPMDSGYVNRALPLLGYPIRIPPGLRSLAALRGFSQLAASFFACWHQGIHHKPLGSSFGFTPGDSLKSFFQVFLACMLDSCVSILGNCFSHKIVGVPALCRYSSFLPRGCQSALFEPLFLSLPFLLGFFMRGRTADRT